MSGEDWDEECVEVAQCSLAEFKSADELSAAAAAGTGATCVVVPGLDCTEQFATSIDSLSPSSSSWDKLSEASHTCEEMQHKKKVFVSNINYRCSQRSLWTHFERFGKVQYCHLVVDRKSQSKGCAYVTFAHEGSATAALDATAEQLTLFNRTMFVKSVMQRNMASANRHVDVRPSQSEDFDDQQFTTEPYQMQSLMQPDIKNINNLLNSHSFLHVLSFLTIKDLVVCESVCRHWYNIVRLHWRQVKQLNLRNLMRSMQLLTDSIMKNLLQRMSSSLQSLCVDVPCNAITDCTLNLIAAKFPQLTSLTLTGAMTVTNAGLKQLGNGCQQLQVLKLTNQRSRVGEDGCVICSFRDFVDPVNKTNNFWWIFHRCKLLRVVNVQGCHLLKGPCFHVIGSKLESLNTANCDKLSDVAMEKVALRCCENLLELNVTECRKLTDKSLEHISKFAKLVSLSCGGVACQFTGMGLMNMQHLHHLQYLDLHDRLITDSFLVTISQNCQQLQSLDISQISEYSLSGLVTDDGLIAIADCCQIKHLNVTNVTEITDSALLAFARVGLLVTMKVRNCSNLTDYGMQCLLSQCLNLTTVDLFGCVHVSARTVYFVIDNVIPLRLPDLSLHLNCIDIKMTPEHISCLKERFAAVIDETGLDIWTVYFSVEVAAGTSVEGIGDVMLPPTLIVIESYPEQCDYEPSFTDTSDEFDDDCDDFSSSQGFNGEDFDDPLEQERWELS